MRYHWVMGRKCPACGFESPADAAFCDFCKEPFRTKASADLRALAPPVPPPSQKIPPLPSPEVKYHISPSAAPGGRRLRGPDVLPREVQAKLDAAFAAGDVENKVPTLPRWFRCLAWAFLGVWFVTGMILGGALLARHMAGPMPPAPSSYP